jgi:hypothetical protein
VALEQSNLVLRYEAAAPAGEARPCAATAVFTITGLPMPEATLAMDRP